MAFLYGSPRYVPRVCWRGKCCCCRSAGAGLHSIIPHSMSAASLAAGSAKLASSYTFTLGKAPPITVSSFYRCRGAVKRACLYGNQNQDPPLPLLDRQYRRRLLLDLQPVRRLFSISNRLFHPENRASSTLLFFITFPPLSGNFAIVRFFMISQPVAQNRLYKILQKKVQYKRTKFDRVGHGTSYHS